MTEKGQDALRGVERKPWFHPGGWVEENEPILDGLVRTISAKLGITVKPGRLLAVHHMYDQQHKTHLSKEGINFLFDCGVIDEDMPFVFGGSGCIALNECRLSMSSDVIRGPARLGISVSFDVTRTLWQRIRRPRRAFPRREAPGAS